jgi:hypothetical protein
MIKSTENAMVAIEVMENDDWLKTHQFELVVLFNTKAFLNEKLHMQIT